MRGGLIPIAIIFVSPAQRQTRHNTNEQQEHSDSADLYQGASGPDPESVNGSLPKNNGDIPYPENAENLHSEPKKRNILFLTITLANLNRFL